ncbi:hypothetical protein BJ508DRAFT_377882 [Ascobolus immersus RN42]|uniref:Uncharacterized protein n=1 Tax=Ascobolus immersus RN42 TaxID=1160509 RepID=A0A3N4I0T6_ASCIM|nr:hypothetical protein BJ508DRAFT_377882 [Ascobolus immersus RN42]
MDTTNTNDILAASQILIDELNRSSDPGLSLPNDDGPYFQGPQQFAANESHSEPLYLTGTYQPEPLRYQAHPYPVPGEVPSFLGGYNQYTDIAPEPYPYAGRIASRLPQLALPTQPASVSNLYLEDIKKALREALAEKKNSEEKPTDAEKLAEYKGLAKACQAGTVLAFDHLRMRSKIVNDIYVLKEKLLVPKKKGKGCTKATLQSHLEEIGDAINLLKSAIDTLDENANRILRQKKVTGRSQNPLFTELREKRKRSFVDSDLEEEEEPRVRKKARSGATEANSPSVHRRPWVYLPNASPPPPSLLKKKRRVIIPTVAPKQTEERISSSDESRKPGRKVYMPKPIRPTVKKAATALAADTSSSEQSATSSTARNKAPVARMVAPEATNPLKRGRKSPIPEERTKRSKIPTFAEDSTPEEFDEDFVEEGTEADWERSAKLKADKKTAVRVPDAFEYYSDDDEYYAPPTASARNTRNAPDTNQEIYELSAVRSPEVIKIEDDSEEDISSTFKSYENEHSNDAYGAAEVLAGMSQVRDTDSAEPESCSEEVELREFNKSA